MVDFQIVHWLVSQNEKAIDVLRRQQPKKGISLLNNAASKLRQIVSRTTEMTTTRPTHRILFASTSVGRSVDIYQRAFRFCPECRSEKLVPTFSSADIDLIFAAVLYNLGLAYQLNGAQDTLKMTESFISSRKCYALSMNLLTISSDCSTGRNRNASRRTVPCAKIVQYLVQSPETLTKLGQDGHGVFVLAAANNLCHINQALLDSIELKHTTKLLQMTLDCCIGEPATGDLAGVNGMKCHDVDEPVLVASSPSPLTFTLTDEDISFFCISLHTQPADFGVIPPAA
jgi:hypothetical protein